MRVSDRLKTVAWLYLVFLNLFCALAIVNIIPVELTDVQKLVLVIFGLACGGLITALIYMGCIIEELMRQ